MKEIVIKGDVILDVIFLKVGGKGLFVKEIEYVLFMKEIDMVVYSMKDMLVVFLEGLMIGCILKCVDFCDVFILKNGVLFKELVEGVILGMSSLRCSV